MTVSQVADTIDALNKAAESPPANVEERRKLYKAARRLMFSVETAHEATQRVYYGGFPLHLAIIGVDLGLFKVLSDESVTHYHLGQLAKTTGSDSLLLCETVETNWTRCMLTCTSTSTERSRSAWACRRKYRRHLLRK